MHGIRERIRRGDETLGAIVTIPSVQVVHALAGAGLDWIIIDVEHGAIDLGAAQAMIAATGGTSTAPFARIPWTHGWQAKAVLDLGVMGVCFPMINDGATATSAVRSLRYPPDGDRLWGPFSAALRWTSGDIAAYVAAANDEMVAIATIEHPDAIDHIDAVAAVPGLDLAFIGPGDLTTAMGISGQVDHPAYLAAVARAETVLRDSSVALGRLARTPEQATAMRERGYRALVLGFDWSLLRDATDRLVRGIRANH